MRGLVIVAALVMVVGAKPTPNNLNNLWKSLTAADGQYVLTQDFSDGAYDWSLERVPQGGVYQASFKTGGGPGATGVQLPLSLSSEEQFYLADPTTQGQTQSQRVLALTKSLNTGLVDASDVLYPAAAVYSGFKPAHGQPGDYYVDGSGEIYYLPAGGYGGQAASPQGSAVQVAKK